MRSRYYQGMTLEAIAQQDGTTREQVWQLVAKGLRELRKPKCSALLRPFVADYDKAYQGTGFNSWKDRGSVEERLVERTERRIIEPF